MVALTTFSDARKPMEIQIQKESPRCVACNKPFAHDQKHYSLLKIDGNNFLREDYCEACWGEHRGSATDHDIYSHWETKYHDPAVARATPQEQFMPLLNLCYESVTQTGFDAEAMAYVCALVLRRQKVFRFVREERDEASGRNVLIFADKHNDTQMRIVDPQLTESQLREVKQRLETHIGTLKEETDEQ
ncbi:MAG: hypothetical protein C4532_17760 [Candidatus Abyssobacteria bacterium SURF_17]|uniref:Uncharacterized protein n=1 Tax=Candidatus Abyssobacteria bacterium SURF_17 TaxID=2093361 RepID=A0A419EQD3_9BACT|nr:MAG: hypothetical protein C4532_17760 [Candidatus Abyssubacteria bacterium SURF_17]